MAENILFQEWRDQHDTANYPFADECAVPRELLDVFVDASLYLRGDAIPWLSSVSVSNEQATVTVTNGTATAQGTVARDAAAENIYLYTDRSVPAGVIVCSAHGVAALMSLPQSATVFTPRQTSFALRSFHPLPADGVVSLGVGQDSLAGLVTLIGEHGVKLRVNEDGVVQVDAIGVNPVVQAQGIRTINLMAPNTAGALYFVSSHKLAENSVLRINGGDASLTFSLMGVKSDA